MCIYFIVETKSTKFTRPAAVAGRQLSISIQHNELQQIYCYDLFTINVLVSLRMWSDCE